MNTTATKGTEMTTKTTSRDITGKFAPAPAAVSHWHFGDIDNTPGEDCYECQDEYVPNPECTHEVNSDCPHYS